MTSNDICQAVENSFVHGKGNIRNWKSMFSRVLMKTLFALTAYLAAFLEYVPIYRGIWRINVFLKRLAAMHKRRAG